MRHQGRVVLMCVGLISMAYARQPMAFFAGWEVAGLALWLAAGRRGLAQAPVVHAPGALLLVMVVGGLIPPFAPPAGGIAQPWPTAVAVAMGLIVLMRSGIWPFDGWVRAVVDDGRRGGPGAGMLTGIYVMAAPCLPAKALVAAPWDLLGTWVLALVGMAGLFGLSLNVVGLRGHARLGKFSVLAGLAAGAVVGFGLAPGSALAGAGAVMLVLAGTVWAAAPSAPRALGFGGALAGMWLVSQGALDLRYGLVGAALVPMLALVMLAAGRRDVQQAPGKPHMGTASGYAYALAIVAIAGLTLMAVYPQAVMELAARPAVQAMAGGVGALTAVEVDRGLGLLVRSSQQVVLAALPASGMAVAVLLATVALYWLRRVAARFMVGPHSDGPFVRKARK
jgi:hypothetical protein